VQRILERAEVGSVEGRDRALRELRPVFDELRPGLLRDELGRRVAGVLSLTSDQLSGLLGHRSPSPQRAGAQAPADFSKTLDPAVRAERAFLALCVALPTAGERALERVDLDEHITSTRLRRAARHLLGRLERPLGGLPPDDEELARVVADLVERAGRAGTVRPEHIEQQRLYLERARLERAIRRALSVSALGGSSPLSRPGGGADVQGPARGLDVQRLAREKEAVRAAIQELDARLEGPV
jgi:DNA primase